MKNRGRVLTNVKAYVIIYRHFERVPVKYRGVEQSVARRAHNPKVVGSSPSSATKKTCNPIRDCRFFLVMQE